MKQRVITGAFILVIVAAIFYMNMQMNNNYPLYFLGLFLVVTAMLEMISMKETEKELPFEVRLFSYIAVIYISLYGIFAQEFNINPRFHIDIIPLVVIFLAISMVLRKNFKVVDASFIFFAIFYVGLTFQSLAFFLLDNAYTLLYLLLIATVTDTFAYFIGSKFGRHKLAPLISPKKTIEGSVGGTVVATILVSIYAHFTIMKDNTLFYAGMMTFLLTIMSQFGDLIASVMKRHFKIKDYGNLFPGHGGVLDRLDSILFTSLTYYYFIQIYKTFIEGLWW